MRLSLANLIDATLSHFSATAVPRSPVALVLDPIQTSCRANTAIALTEVTLTQNFFTRSPLVGEMNPAVANLIGILFNDESVQRAAGACAAKRLRLTELAGFKSDISLAIQTAIASDEGRGIANVTPAMVAEVLRQRAEDVDAAIDVCREDHAAHKAAAHALVTRRAPLREAVSARLTHSIAERDHLAGLLDSAKRAASMGLLSADRFAVLRNAGLSEDQIASAEPDAVSPQALETRRRARIVEITPQIAAMRAFRASPTFDAALLAGLGFDALINARHAAEVAA